MNKLTATSIVIAMLLIGGVMFLSSENTTPTDSNGGTTNNSNSNVSIENGVQIISLNAKGGYSPRRSVAQAGIPTVIRFKTNGTFDCSLSVRIPSLNISKFLAQTGTTDINIGTQQAGRFQGSCGMGMYPFEVYFK